MKPVQETGGDVFTAISNVPRGAIRGTGEISGDLTKVTMATVSAAIGAAKDAGLSVEDAASAAVTGALEAAGNIGESAVHAVTQVVGSTVDGVTVVTKGK